MRKLIIVLVWFLSSISVFAFEVLPDQVPVPADNLQTPAKIQLGKKLFMDPRLSVDDTVSCNSCHNTKAGGVDGLQFSKGVKGQLGGRNAPTVLNAVFQTVQFWDGRAPSLEEQAKGPIINPVEMGMKDHKAVVEKIKKIPEYQKEFKEVFGSKDAITIDNIAKAIASFERTLVTPNSAFDRYLKGEKKALSPKAIRGMQTFEKLGCVACHSGRNFSGPALPQGQGFYQKFPLIGGSDFEKKYDLLKDQGRFDVTKKEEDRHQYRVPSLRNVAMTAPYFHNGAVKTLDEAVKVMGKTQLGKDLSKNEIENIVEFLKSLNGEVKE